MADATCSVDGCGRQGKIRRGWCEMHYDRWRRHGDPLVVLRRQTNGTTDQRFFAKVEEGPVPDFAPELGPCLLWTASRGAAGYGLFWNGTHRESGAPRIVPAHRWAWEHEHGPIPPDEDVGYRQTVDHLCRVRSCVRVDHLDLVSHTENVLRGFGPTAVNARKTHCVYGHPLVGDNLILDGHSRACRRCARENWRAYRRRQERR